MAGRPADQIRRHNLHTSNPTSYFRVPYKRPGPMDSKHSIISSSKSTTLAALASRPILGCFMINLMSFTAFVKVIFDRIIFRNRQPGPQHKTKKDSFNLMDV
ncbi:uncharacterized protein PGTG_07168 [Puccinia graminis f. sp. tritici CRL 75-36-700-3]|uniref:Uncharacterized protein n=1 Tax=Puccinia graminis f. sp. tritici (strain CRL 75-36-700-3 / race SCCL) TaxID=418459 RepID=E3K9N0_PUCGT|nr:uncharacterized protein PGTG_07168 [Puccinia graminis f. sp. tritici CRL 75-36-700-3]EFP80916.2 hypothetical protein PGTG_07168 [Puccinia graminis f. sp. tritici CRL 75-36-700-3]